VNMEPRNLDVLVTGQIRDVRIAELSFAALLIMKRSAQIRRIVFSAWEDDLLNKRDFASMLRRNGVEILENHSTLLKKSQGNYLQQVTTFKTGLDSIEDGVYVFKTRPDLIFKNLHCTMKNALDGISGKFSALDIIFNHTSTNQDRRKIWVPSFVAAQPFFIADQTFMGMSQDLRSFLFHSGRYDTIITHVPNHPGSATHPSAALAETQFWISPFLAKYPLLHNYLDLLPYSFNGYQFYEVLEKYLFSVELYQWILAIYWVQLMKTFYVSPGDFVIANGLADDGRIIVRAKSHTRKSENLIFDLASRNHRFPFSYSDTDALKSGVATNDIHFNDIIRKIDKVLGSDVSTEFTPSLIAQKQSLLDRLKNIKV
jgi:hypothetical protein